MYYRNLRGAIASKGIKYKKVAEVLGISTKALSNKMNRKSPFTWEEVCIIQKEFFPGMEKEYLFATDTGQKSA